MAAGSIVVDLLMKTGSFETDTKRAQKSLKNFEKSVDDFAVKVGTGIAVAGAAMAAMVMSTTKAAEEINRFARLSNASAESFQMMAAGASTVGIQTDKLADIFKDVQDKVGDFIQTGGGALADFFENIAPKVGITADEFRRLSGPEALQLYVSSLEKANLSQSDMIFYLEAIASDSSLLLPLLKNNGQAMQEFGEQAKASGQIMSDDLIKNSIEFRRQMDQLTGILKGFANAITQEVLPYLIKMSVEFRTGMENANGLFDAISKFGTINPFRSNTENLKIYREELKKLEAFRAGQVERGGIFGSTAAVDKDIEDVVAKIKYLEALEKRLFSSTIQTVPYASQDPRTGRGYQAPSSIGSGPTKKELDAAKKASEEALKQRELYDTEMRALNDAQNQYQLNAQEKRINAELEKEEQYQAMLREFDEAQLANWNKVQDQRDAAIQESARSMKALADGMGDAFAGAFENAILSGQRLSDVLKDLANDMLRLITRQLVTGPLAAAISGSIQGAMGAPGAAPASGGPRASGGPVTGGMSYLVGERGPELFVPSTTGKILPNSAMGGSSVSVNVVNNSGATAKAEETTDSRGNRRVNITIGELVAGEVRRQGSGINQAMRQTFGTSPTLVGR